MTATWAQYSCRHMHMWGEHGHCCTQSWLPICAHQTQTCTLLSRRAHPLPALTHAHTHTCPAVLSGAALWLVGRPISGGWPHTLKGSMPGGDTALDGAMEVRELGSSPLTVLQLRNQMFIFVALLSRFKVEKEKKNLRFIKVSRVDGVRELGGVAVDERALVCGIGFPRCLIFGKVPTSCKFGLQSLVTTEFLEDRLLPRV